MSPKIERICAIAVTGICILAVWSTLLWASGPPPGLVAEAIALTDSGRPAKSEREAIQGRLREMKASMATRELVVFPVRLGNELSQENAVHLAELIREGFGWRVEVADTPLPLEVAPNRSEQKVLWGFARAFQAQLRENSPPADYALLADYHLSPRDGRVMAVHFVVCDRRGEWVIVDFSNSHHADFRRISPTSASDCDRLVASRLQGYWDD